MKYLFVAVMFFASNAGAQTVGELQFDKMPINVHGPKTETFDVGKFICPIAITEFRLNLDSIKKVNLELYNYWMRLLGNDTVPICKHIYVAVEPVEVKISYTMPTYTLANIPRETKKGKHEGQEIVCVKCFHVRKQILDYGGGDDPNVVPPKDK